MKVAVIQHNSFNKWRVIKVPENKGWKTINERDWLHPYLNYEWHLLSFADVEGE